MKLKLKPKVELNTKLKQVERLKYWSNNNMLHWSLIVSALGAVVAGLGAYCGWSLFPTMIHKKVEQVSQ